MSKLRIRNCGPIRDGLDTDDGFISFSKSLLLIGDQGTGKSTIAKLFSIFSWLEKAFFRGDYQIENFETSDFEDLYNNQLLSNAFSNDTQIEYIGDAYRFSYLSGLFNVKVNDESLRNYKRPKIMYVPSERNILSVVKNVDDVDNLPPMLRLLRTRYLQAGEGLGKDGIFKLPLNGYKIQVHKDTGETYVIEEKSGNSVPLMNASSGLQSIVPSSLVTDYLANESKKTILERLKRLNGNKLKELQKEINDEVVNAELNRFITSGITKSISETSLIKISAVAKKYVNECFVNIVEEPEQNLFPESQIKNLEFLFDCMNRNDSNKLIVTTHSPYVLSYVTLASKAYELSKKNVNEKQIDDIVLKSSWVDGNNTNVYQLENGKIKKLSTYGRGLPSDDNMLNSSLSKSNDLFDALLDLEEEYSD